MNHCLPDWNFEGDLPITTQKKPMGGESELVEILWRNGQVVLQSQTQRKLGPTINEGSSNKQVLNTKQDQQTLTLSNVIQDEETVSWIQYPLEDSFEKDFYSNFLYEIPSSVPMENDKPTRDTEEGDLVKFDTLAGSTPLVSRSHQLGGQVNGNPMPPPKYQFGTSDPPRQEKSSGGYGKVVNFSQLAAPIKGDLLGQCDGQVGGRSLRVKDGRECNSVVTVGSSHCGSNQVRNDFDMSRGSSNAVGTTPTTTTTTSTDLSARTLKGDVWKVASQSERLIADNTLEPTLTSSSGGSGSSFGRTYKQQSTGVSTHKRKTRDGEYSECQSEAAEFESAANKPNQRSGSVRKSRSAEVHNLSERKRRDRINEKMRALQELIPHCNKTDKASMLDEAIEYLKSLQLQLQIMWMGGGMTPMMFPGVQQYMSRMSMGMGSPGMPSLHNPLQMPRVPLVDRSMSMAALQNQPVMCQNPVLNSVNYQNQMQNPGFPMPYARFMGFPHMQTAPQAANMFRFGPQAEQQQNPTLAQPGCSTTPPIFGEAATTNVHPNGNTG